jgi:hypothetical protein|tara:strand:- start:701 stop:976 length:276 start_codon:yes stop_codon:yes gene_type:complete
MTVLEIMERAGSDNTTLTVAWIKDAIHLIQSNYDDNVATWKTNITDGTREYPFPANMVRLKSISVKDTNDKKYKKIRRLIHDPTVREDTDP